MRPRLQLMLGLLTILTAQGCSHEEKSDYTSVTKPPTVRLLQPPLRNIVRVVGQPSFIEAYERTSVYPKLTAYIEKWIVDIGDKVKKGDVLATLFVPELVEDYGTKKATVKLDQERVDLALKVVEVVAADVKAAQAQLDESKLILAKFQAEVDRWDIEVKRLTREVARGVVDPQVLNESTNQWKSSIAARNAAEATVRKSDAELLSEQARLVKVKVDVEVARAALAVAESEQRRLEAWVGYLVLPAPFDGIIVVRNANTFDFVLPSTGDPSAMVHSPHIAPDRAAPIYVVDRTDIVRIFVDIPEHDANYVQIGTKASIVVRAYRDDPIPGTVTRTAWALNVKSRTLRAEIDLPNPNSQLLPGMYAYANVIIERPDVRAVPQDALEYQGDTTYCWLYENGKAQRTPIRTGVTDGEWIEVTSVQRSTKSKAGEWKPFDGSEQVILGDLSILTEGAAVQVATKKSETKEKGQETEKNQAKEKSGAKTARLHPNSTPRAAALSNPGSSRR